MTTEKRLDQLESKLAHLKRRDRWIITVMVLAVGAWIAVAEFGPMTGVAVAQTSRDGETVRANKFILVDQRGQACAVLRVSQDGPGLYFYDQRGIPRAVLGISQDGPVLGFTDERGKTRVALHVLQDGPGLSFADEGGKMRVALGVSQDGPVLGLFDERGKASAGLNVSGLVFYDTKGKELWSAP